MFSSLFPHGIAHYAVGGALMGLGVALLYVVTGRPGGVSTFFSSSWSWLLDTPFFRQASFLDSRNWRLVYALGLLLGGGIYLLAGLPVEASHIPAWKLAIGGLFFGFGLAWSTMIRPESVLDFLTLNDLGLLFVLGCAVDINLLVYQLAPRLLEHTLLGAIFQQRPFVLDRSALLGGVLFGIGWGICGVCPGPALAGLGAGNRDLLIALAGIFAGTLLHGLWAGRQRTVGG